MERTLVYVSGALSDLPEALRTQYIALYEAIGRTVGSVGLVPYVPHQHTDPIRHRDVTPKGVDVIDRTAVTSSALIIAVADNPSLGVGIEVEMAYHAAKPVVLLCRRDRLDARRISRLIRGNPAVVRELVYEREEDALEQLEGFLRSWLRERSGSILPASLKE